MRTFSYVFVAIVFFVLPIHGVAFQIIQSIRSMRRPCTIHSNRIASSRFASVQILSPNDDEDPYVRARKIYLDSGGGDNANENVLEIGGGSDAGGGWGRGKGGGGDNDDNENDDGNPVADVFADAKEQGKKAVDDLTGLFRGMGPTIQFMPRRIPSLLRNPMFAQQLKIYFSQFPQLIRLFSLMGKDLLYLHSMAAVAGGCTIAFNMWVRAPVVGKRVVAFPITWNGIFMAINILQVQRLLKERRPIDFTGREAEAFEKFFEGRISARGFHSLMRDCGGKFISFPQSHELCTQGKSVKDLMFLIEGSYDVFVDGAYVSTVPEKSFIGEMSFLETYDGDKGVHRKKVSLGEGGGLEGWSNATASYFSPI